MLSYYTALNHYSSQSDDASFQLGQLKDGSAIMCEKEWFRPVVYVGENYWWRPGDL